MKRIDAYKRGLPVSLPESRLPLDCSRLGPTSQDPAQHGFAELVRKACRILDRGGFCFLPIVGHDLHFRHPMPHNKSLLILYEKDESSQQVYRFIHPISWFEKTANGAF